MRKNACFIFSGLLSAAAIAQTVSFTQPAGSPITMGTSSLRGLASADLNGDSKKDFVIGNGVNSTVSVYLGAGNGQFTQANGSPFTVGSEDIYNVIADFNNDMIPDLATANYNSGNISVLLGTGTGSFTTSATITTGSLPYCIDAKDFNMDGKMDIVTVAAGAAKAYVFLGNGAGAFTAAAGSPISTGAMPYHVSTGLFNADNYPDFAVANGSGGNISVFLGTGTGSFTIAPGSPYAAGSEPRTIAVKDLNNDSHPDLVVANGTGNNISILLGQANGSFTTAAGSPIASGTYAYQAALADYDSDGRTDIAVTNGTNNTVRILLGSGNGSFTNATGSPISVGTDPQPVCTDDFNGDGKADLLVGDWESNKVTVLMNGNTVGITEYTRPGAIEVYPNPATDQLTISISDFKSGMDLTVYNAIGQQVDRVLLLSKETVYTRPNLPKGVYTFRINDKTNTVQTGKIIFE